LATTARSPQLSSSSAAATVVALPVSCSSSSSLRIRQSTERIVRSSASRALSIQKFIESMATKRRAAALLAHAELEVGLDVGQEEHVAVLGRGESLGSKVGEDVEVGDVRHGAR
jgi:hypothetical protein